MPTSAASAVAQNSDAVLLPMAASGSHRRGTWKPVKLSQEHLIMSGGFHAKFEVVPAILYQSGNTTHRFVELCKNAQWFLKGVGGLNTRKGDLTAVKVMQAVTKQFFLAIVGADEVADAEAQDADSGEDPMDDLDDVLIPTPKAKAKAKAKGKNKQATVADVEMPKRPPCTGADQTDTIWISVYSKATGKPGRAKLFLRSDFLDWLLSYAADELHFQGVVRAAAADESRPVANCAAVADVNLQWDFSVKAWKAEYVSGPFVGATRCFHVVDLTTWHWARMTELSFFESTKKKPRPTLSDQKGAAKIFITHWCLAISAGRASEFEKTWQLDELLVASAKRSRGAGGQGTAVAEEPETAGAEESAEED
jgi:hypothetical protein